MSPRRPNGMSEMQECWRDLEPPPSEVTYVGHPTDDCGGDIMVGRPRGAGQIAWRKLPLFLKIANHSPTGFSWGYNGSGPTQAAVAILFDYTGDKHRALEHSVRFRNRVLAGFEQGKPWTLTGTQIDRVLRELEGGG